jgi:DNA-directed RNA polymerase subunit RPC12/RpoP
MKPSSRILKDDLPPGIGTVIIPVPQPTGSLSEVPATRPLSVSITEGESVEWIWTLLPSGGSYVSGFEIVSPPTGNPQMNKLETKCAKCGMPQLVDQVPTRIDGWYGIRCTNCKRSFFMHWVGGRIVESKAMKPGRATNPKKGAQ